ncbi:hypothetical protein HY229_04145 [Candidatus Acetothermia bacterium]|nr:hypothetical protein [Candidatus Acetothermia bacterium]MBI3643275.1 hypothetical protein [Candidatus Acetothermia bacterium]
MRGALFRWILRVLFSLLLVLSFAYQTGLADVSLDVEVGFGGQFMSGQYTLVQVVLQYQGPPLTGELALHQEYKSPLESEKSFSERRTVRLGSNVNQLYQFYFPVSRSPWPNEDQPALSITLSSNGSVVFSKRVPLAGDVEPQPLVLGVSETNFPRMLTTGERIESVGLNQLPEDWRGYDGVRRIYLGRARTDQLTKRQQDAIQQWITRGGEFVVLGGENFYLQDSSWLRQIIPFDVSGIEAAQASSDLPTYVAGKPLGEVLIQRAAIPLLVEQRVVNGIIFFSVLDLSQQTELSQAIWNDLRQTSSLLDNQPPDLGSKILGNTQLAYPSKPLLGALLILYLIGFAYISLWMLRQPLNTLLSSPEGGEMRRKRQGWKVLAFVVGWMLIFAVPSLAYLGQPRFHSYFQSLEVGLIRAQEGSSWGWSQSWYSVISKKERSLSLAASDNSLILPLGQTQLELLQERPDAWDLDFSPNPMKSWSTENLYTEEMVPLDIGVRADKEGGDVRGSRIQVYNGSQWNLRDAVLFRNGVYYPIGEVPAGKSLTAELSGLGLNEWSPWSGFKDLWSIEERVKNVIMNQLGITDELKRDRSQWVLLGWAEVRALTQAYRENRQGLSLILIRSKEQE